MELCKYLADHREELWWVFGGVVDADFGLEMASVLMITHWR